MNVPSPLIGLNVFVALFHPYISVSEKIVIPPSSVALPSIPKVTSPRSYDLPRYSVVIVQVPVIPSNVASSFSTVAVLTISPCVNVSFAPFHPFAETTAEIGALKTVSTSTTTPF